MPTPGLQRLVAADGDRRVELQAEGDRQRGDDAVVEAQAERAGAKRRLLAGVAGVIVHRAGSLLLQV
ncbi:MULTISPECIES: hypothetical protein [Mesorhizobium]|uniref:hypothetical protein n=1 Tax=Mesorhizobium australicum TaxID=536018 RepID=UPI00333D531E